MFSWFFRSGRWLVNRVGGGLDVAGLRAFDLDPDRITAAARRQSGLMDLGDQPWPDGLARACTSFHRDADLSPFGRFVVHGALVRMQANRLRLVEARKRHPEVFSRPLVPPVLVTGLPRSGTTLLQRLLGTLPGSRGIPIWQSRHPIVLDGRDLRRAHMAVDNQLLVWMAPELMAKHAFELDSPEEAIPLFDAAGGWNPFLWRIGGCVSYLEQVLAEEEVHSAYTDFFDQLRWLQRDRPDTRLVLKTPNHMGYLEAFLAQAPEAVVIQTHRDPAVTVPSYSSLAATMHGVSREVVDKPLIGQASLELWATLADRSLAARSRLPAGRVIDVDYDALRDDGVGEALRVCQAAGIGGADDLRERFASELASRPQHRHGKHVYSLEEYGLSRDLVHTRFDAYLRAHLPRLRESESAPPTG